jgi:hypothetical protein
MLMLMLSVLRRIQKVSLRSYSATAQSSSKVLSAIEQLEQDGARLLRTVQKRVEQRAKLLAQLSEDSSSLEDVKRMRQAKDLEPLKVAWDEWERNRRVGGHGPAMSM